MEYCSYCERHHEPRIRPVPCHGCRVMTMSPHAMCPTCLHDSYNAEQDAIGDKLLMAALEERDA